MAEVADESLWPHALQYAVYLHNIMPTEESGVSPLEVWSLVAPSGFPDFGILVGNYGPERNSGRIDRILEEFRFSGILVFER